MQQLTLRLRWLLYLAIFVGLTASVHMGASLPGRPAPVAADTPQLLGVRLAPADALPAGPITPLYSVDYGAFVWWVLPQEVYADFQSRALPHDLFPDPFALQLGERPVDIQAPLSLPPDWPIQPQAKVDYSLVQLIGPPQADWLAQLEAAGLQIVQYLHPFTYVVWGELSQVAKLETAGFIYGTSWFSPEYRLLPRYRDGAAEASAWRALIYGGADVAAVQQALADLSRNEVTLVNLNEQWAIASVALSAEQLPLAAQIPGLYSLQPAPNDGGLRGEMANQVNVNNVNGSNLAYPGYFDWLAEVGLSGAGVRIANVDSGIYNTHPDLLLRLVNCVGTTCGGAAVSTHGTHTAGIMAADASSGVQDGLGFYRGQGVAPGASLVEQVYSPFYLQPGGMLLLMTDSYRNGASLSGNSWGPSGSPQGYDNDTLQVDIGVRDADPAMPGNQALTFVLSFMNGYGGVSTQGTPDEAKNIITVGSTKMQTGAGQQILQIDDLSSNSAHGPALDGRTIPHLVAPGCSVDSTFSATGYGLLCGTSMASPHVSGGVALFIEYYRALTGVSPSPALIKAALLVGAHDLAGHLDADGNVMGHPFDSQQGWGRFNLEAVVDPTWPILYWDQTTLFDDTGDEWSHTVYPVDPGAPMRWMLVWTDAPGHGLGGSTPAWNNDLDLIVEQDGLTFAGNAFGLDGWSLPGGEADYRNNTEGIFLPADPAPVVVRIRASNLNSDGVPGIGDSTDQDWSLVCTNCTPTPPAAPLVALTKSVTPAAMHPGGNVTFHLTRTLSLTGAYTLTETIHDVLPAGLTILTPTLTLNGAPAPYLYDANSGQLAYTWSAVPFSDSHIYTITYQALVDEITTVGETLVNMAESLSTVEGYEPASASSSAALQVIAPPAVSLTKVAASPARYAGDTLAYFITRDLTYTGDHSFTEILTDSLPAGLRVLTDTIVLNGAPAPHLYDPASHALHYQIASAAFSDHDQLQLQYQVQITAEVTQGIVLSNTVVTTLHLPEATQPLTASATALITVYPPLPYGVVVTKQVDQATISVGGRVTFTLQRTYSHPGLHTVTEQLTDTLPTGLSLLPDSILLNGVPAPYLYDPVTGGLIYTFPPLTFNDSDQWTITYEASLLPGVPFGTDLTNIVSLQPTMDGALAPIPLTASVTVTSVPAGHLFLPLTPKQ